MTKMDYTCELCGKPGQADYNHDYVHKADFWKLILHCNRCADFKVNLRNLRDRCKAACIYRWQLQKENKLTPERDDVLHDKLTRYTKEISRLTCQHWRVDIVWDQDFVSQMRDFQDKSEFIVNQYALMIKNKAQELYAQARMGI